MHPKNNNQEPSNSVDQVHVLETMSTEVNNNTFNNSSNTVSTGKEGCKCTNMTDVLASLKDRTCQLPDGNSGVQMSVSGQCVPYSYGSGSCLPHDMWYDRRCMKISSGVEEVDSTITINNEIPEYCSRTWCYVDKSCARLSEEQLVRSEYFLTDDIALNAVSLPPLSHSSLHYAPQKASSVLCERNDTLFMISVFISIHVL